jgi:MobA/MobL family.
MMYRFDMKPRYRTKGTQSAAEAVRYLCREGEFAPDVQAKETDVAYLTRTRRDTVDRGDLVGAPIIGNLPGWAKGDAGVFFSVASREETLVRIRKDGTREQAPYAWSMQIALPRELSHADQMRLAEDFVTVTMPDKPYLLVKHEPVRDGEAQPHVHILMSPRTMDGIERSEGQMFRRYNGKNPERGGARKERFWSQRYAPEVLRDTGAILANVYLEQAGVEERIDPRGLQKRGISRDRISWTNKVELDAATKRKEMVQAIAAWDTWKLTNDMTDIATQPREEVVRRVKGWMRAVEPRKAVERSSPDVVLSYLQTEEERLVQALAQTEQAKHRVHSQVMRGEHRQRTPRETGPQVEHEGAQNTRSPRRPARGTHQPTPQPRVVRTAEVMLDDDAPGGLIAPDGEKKRGRDGYEW